MVKGNYPLLEIIVSHNNEAVIEGSFIVSMGKGKFFLECGEFGQVVLLILNYRGIKIEC